MAPPDDVLDGNGQRKIGRCDADVADHVGLQEAKALAHAHGQAQHQSRAAHDQGHVESGQVGLFHASHYWQSRQKHPPVRDTL